VDGHVSLEVSPLLARDPAATAAQAVEVAERVGRANLLVKIPGTAEGLPAITQTIRAGIAVNVTLLFDAAQFHAANNAVREGLEQRLADGNPIDIASVASVFVSRWDKAVADKVSDDLLNRLGVNVMNIAWEEYQRQLDDPAWRRLMNHGARPQRLLWASTGTKDPNAPETLYVDELAAPLTVNTMPEKTLLATVESGAVGPRLDVAAAKAELERFAEAGVDVAALGRELQDEGVVLFEAAWHDVLDTLAGKASQLEAQQTA
jgi:transaldolase